MKIESTVYKISRGFMFQGKKRAYKIGMKWSELLNVFINNYTKNIEEYILDHQLFSDYISSRVPLYGLKQIRYFRLIYGYSIQELLSNAIYQGLKMTDEEIKSISIDIPQEKINLIRPTIELKIIQIENLLKEIKDLLN